MAKKRKPQSPKKERKSPEKPIIKTSGTISLSWQFLENISASRRVFWICAALLPLAVIAYYPSSEALRNDYDIWFHLAYGKHYVQNLTWHIDHSIYSWTPARAEAMYVTWIGSSIIYLVHSTLSVPGLFVLRMALLLASGAIVLRFAKKANIRPGIGLLAGLLLVAITLRIGAHYVKPEMFSIFMATLAIAFYFRFRMVPAPWIIAAFPLLFLLWINTHGLWRFGLGFLGIVFAVDIILYLVRRRMAPAPRAMRYLAIAAGATLLALCINPFGPAHPLGIAQSYLSILPSVLFSSGSGAETLEHYTQVAAYQNMWEHLFFSTKQNLFFTISALAMVFMIISLLTAWAVSWRRSGYADLPVAAANIAFFFMGMFMARLLLIFPLIWIFSLVFFAWRTGQKSLFPRTGPMLLFAFLVLTGYTAFVAACVYAAPSWFGTRYQEYVPDMETRYIMASNLPGPLFNDYLSGGYLLWAMYPEYRVFIDPRHFPYSEQVFPDYNRIGTKYPLSEKGLQSFTEKYPAQIALINYDQKNLILWLHQSPDWTPAYFDKTAVVMVHRNVIPTLSQEARTAMRSPEKYRDVGNPIILSNLFNVYNTFLGPRYAQQILDIYEQNVSNRFWWKQSELTEMRQILERSRKRK